MLNVLCFQCASEGPVIEAGEAVAGSDHSMPTARDWVLVAMVIDRACFIMGMLVTLMSTIILFVD